MLPCLQKLSCCWLGVTILKHCSALSSQWWQPRKAWGRGKMRVRLHTEDYVDVKLPDNPVVVVQRPSVLLIPFFYPSLSCSLLTLIVHSRLGLFLLITPQHSLWFSSQIVNHLSWAAATDTVLCLSRFLFSLNKPGKGKQKGVLKRFSQWIYRRLFWKTVVHTVRRLRVISVLCKGKTKLNKDCSCVLNHLCFSCSWVMIMWVL